MGLNRSLLGKEYDPQSYVVSAEATMAYARAYNEDNAWFFYADRPEGVLAPPLFGAVASWLSLIMVVTDAELNVDILRLVHSRQDMRFLHPIVSGDTINSTAKIGAIEEQPGGESLAVDIDCCNQTGETVQHITFTALIRDQARRPRKRTADNETPDREPLHRISQTLDADQTFRYANASGDHNPIHIDEDIAKLAGLPGIIVHGLCTLAFASKAIIDSVCEKDPRRLRRLSAGFARPVLPGQTITTAIWPDTNPGSYRYETVNPNGRAVIKPGYAEIREVL